MRARRVISIRNVLLRTRRALSRYKVYGNSALLVLKITSLTINYALLVLSWRLVLPAEWICCWDEWPISVQISLGGLLRVLSALLLHASFQDLQKMQWVWFVRLWHKIYFIIKSTKDFHYHENHQKVLGIWFFKDFEDAEFLGSNHFQEGVCKKKKKKKILKIFTWDTKFSHLLQNLELALKFQILVSDKKANLSD